MVNQIDTKTKITSEDPATQRAIFLSDTYDVFTFPIPPNKKFTTEKWHDQSHNLTGDITKQFEGLSKNSNIGIDLSKFTDPQFRLFALDFDVEKEKNDDGSIKKVEGKPVFVEGSTKHLTQFHDIIKKFNIPNTLTTRSAGGGFHIILKVSKAIYKETGIKSSSKKKIPNYDRLDIVTGNVVAPTSMISDSKYKEYNIVDESAIAEAPVQLLFWLKNSVFNGPNTDSKKSSSKDFTSDLALSQEECLQYIVTMAPRAIEGQGGDETTLAVSDYLWDLTDIPEVVELAMTLYNNTKCEPPWDTNSVEFKKFLRDPSQRAYRQTEAGEKGPKIFSDFPHYTPNVNQFGKISINRMDLYNVVLARANEKDQGRVNDNTEIPQKMFRISSSFKVKGNYIDHTLSKSIIGTYELKSVYLTLVQAEHNYEYVPFKDNTKGQKGRAPSIIKYLAKARRFHEVESHAFMPNFPSEIMHNNIYNTFNGFAIEYSQNLNKVYNEKYQARIASKVIYKRFFDILMLWADNDKAQYIWLKQWLAKRLQEPAWKPQTSIVVQGEYGSGKSIILSVMKLIMGESYVRILSGSELENSFNGLNENSLITVFDELDKIADNKIVKKLDAMIGNASEVINAKGIDQKETVSYSGIVITCNNLPKQILQANQRRFQICEMSNEKMQNHEFFKPLFFVNESKKRQNISQVEMEGLILIYKELMQTELTENTDRISFSTSIVSKSIDRLEQSTKGFSTWFMTRIIQEKFNGHKGNYLLEEDTEFLFTKPPLWDDYHLFALENGIEDPYNYPQFSKLLKQRGKIYSARTNRIKKYKNGEFFKFGTQRKWSINYTDHSGVFHGQEYTYIFPPLSDLRRKILKAFGSAVIDATPDGSAVMLEFLQEYIDTPPYRDLIETKKEAEMLEFEEYADEDSTADF